MERLEEAQKEMCTLLPGESLQSRSLTRADPWGKAIVMIFGQERIMPWRVYAKEPTEAGAEHEHVYLAKNLVGTVIRLLPSEIQLGQAWKGVGPLSMTELLLIQPEAGVPPLAATWAEEEEPSWVLGEGTAQRDPLWKAGVSMGPKESARQGRVWGIEANESGARRYRVNFGDLSSETFSAEEIIQGSIQARERASHESDENMRR
jgi:hypothetical protein